MNLMSEWEMEERGLWPPRAVWSAATWPTAVVQRREWLWVLGGVLAAALLVLLALTAPERD